MERFSHNTRTWEPPIELQRSTPREVTLTGSGRAAAIGAVLLVTGGLVAFVVMLSIASRDAKRWAGWQAEAVSTSGKVVEAHKSGSGDDAKQVMTYHYWANGVTYEGHARLNYRRWRNVGTGTMVPVSYRRSAPGTHWITGGNEPRGLPMVAAFLIPLCLLVPSVLLPRELRRQRRLLEEGRGARGRVTAVKKYSTDKGRQYRVNYEFATLEGAQRTGRYTAHRQAPEVGAEIVVLYHADEEKWSAKYPLSWVRVAGMD